MSIFQQYLQPPKSMVDRMAAFADLDARKEDLTARRQQNALQARTMRRSQEADEIARGDRDEIARLALSSRGDQNALIQALQGSGRISLQDRAAAMVKQRDEQRNVTAQASEREANAGKTRFATEQERHKAVLEAVSAATDQGSYVRAVQSLAARGFDVSQVPQQFSPEFVSQAGMQALTALQRLNAAEKAKDQQIAVRGQDVTAGTAIRGQDMVDRRTREEGAANRGVQMRGQNMTDARTREKNATDASAVSKVEWKQDTNGNWVALPKAVDMAGGPVAPVGTTARGRREVQAGQAINIIDEAEKVIKRGTSSYLGAAVDQGARVFGASTKGADAAAELKAMEGALMMAQPRMEGPQSNLDVDLYRQMAGRIGDSTIPVSQKESALKQIRQLHAKYAGPKSGASSTLAPASGGKPSVSNW